MVRMMVSKTWALVYSALQFGHVGLGQTGSFDGAYYAGQGEICLNFLRRPYSRQLRWALRSGNAVAAHGGQWHFNAQRRESWRRAADARRPAPTVSRLRSARCGIVLDDDERHVVH